MLFCNRNTRNTLPARELQTAAPKKHNRTKPRKIRKENHPMITNPFQRKAYDAVAAALPFAIDPAKITVEPGVSYLPSPVKLHDYAAGVMAAFAGCRPRP